MRTLEGKCALVTGANRGIGRAIALRLASEGAKVVLCARDRTLLDRTAEEISRAGGKARSIALDLRLAESARAAIDFAMAAFERLDILVNNAGATKRGEFAELTDDDWMDGFALKFFGSVRLAREAWPHLTRQSGSVVNIAGSGGRTPGPQFTIGGSVNAALLSFTKALADIGLRDGVQVNAINPGPVRTARLEKRLAQTAASHSVSETEALAIFMREEKISKIAEPADIAALVAFIVSPHGRSMHGALVDIDGGLTKTI